jgi:hypothetical protein
MKSLFCNLYFEVPSFKITFKSDVKYEFIQEPFLGMFFDQFKAISAILVIALDFPFSFLHPLLKVNILEFKRLEHIKQSKYLTL